MLDEEFDRFARCYRGRHQPVDALWWLDRPDEDGPSGAQPPQREVLQSIEHLEFLGRRTAACLLQVALGDRLAEDRRDTERALTLSRCGGRA